MNTCLDGVQFACCPDVSTDFNDRCRGADQSIRFVPRKVQLRGLMTCKCSIVATMTESSWTRLSRSIPTKIAAAPTKTKVPGRRFVRRLRRRPATLAVVRYKQREVARRQSVSRTSRAVEHEKRRKLLSKSLSYFCYEDRAVGRTHKRSIFHIKIVRHLRAALPRRAHLVRYRSSSSKFVHSESRVILDTVHFPSINGIE